MNYNPYTSLYKFIQVYTSLYKFIQVLYKFIQVLYKFIQVYTSLYKFYTSLYKFYTSHTITSHTITSHTIVLLLNKMNNPLNSYTAYDHIHLTNEHGRVEYLLDQNIYAVR